MTKVLAWILLLVVTAGFVASFRTQTLLAEVEQMQHEVSRPAPSYVEFSALCDTSDEIAH